MGRFREFLSALATLGVLAAFSTRPVVAQTADTMSVLFVGNSLTYWNDLPGMVGALLLEDGVASRIGAVVGPNMGLEDHWREGVVFDSLRADGWDVVVMQQGPSATEGRPSLLHWSARFADSIVAWGARPALYMVWPAEARQRDFPGVIDSYATAADQIDGLLFPVGAAWGQVMAEDPTIPLYGPDRFHPAPPASYLAALIIYQQLGGTDPTTLAREQDLERLALDRLGLSPDQIGVLRRAAADANARYRR
jgi:hypothetical protein